MTRAEEFEQLRALLFAIACRILGSVSDQWPSLTSGATRSPGIRTPLCWTPLRLPGSKYATFG